MRRLQPSLGRLNRRMYLKLGKKWLPYVDANYFPPRYDGEHGNWLVSFRWHWLRVDAIIKKPFSAER